MPTELDALFSEAGFPIFPEQGELEMTCGCPDWGNPCKHVSAVLYLLAEAFDDDPFLVLAWRGKPRSSSWTTSAPPPRNRWKTGSPTSTRSTSRPRG